MTLTTMQGTAHLKHSIIITSQRVLNRYRTCNKQILLYMMHYFKSKSTRCTFSRSPLHWNEKTCCERLKHINAELPNQSCCGCFCFQKTQANASSMFSFNDDTVLPALQSTAWCTMPTLMWVYSMVDKSFPLPGQCVMTTDDEVALAALRVDPRRSPARVTRPQH